MRKNDFWYDVLLPSVVDAVISKNGREVLDAAKFAMVSCDEGVVVPNPTLPLAST